MTSAITMPPIRALLVGTDFSPASEPALVGAARLAARFGASVDLLHVVEDSGSTVPGTLPPALGAQVRAQADAVLQRLLPGEVCPFRRVEARFGRTVETLLEAAQEWSADLLVVGTHGRTGLEHLALGSVAEHLASVARVDVLLVRSGIELQFRRLLVALNATRPALRAAARAVQVARACGSERLDAVTGFQLPLGWTELPGTYEAHFSRFRVLAEEDVRAGREQVRLAGLPGECEVLEGDAKRVVLAAVARHRSDLVFAGAHNRSRLASWLLGDTARALAHRLPCSVWFTRGEVEAAPVREAIGKDLGFSA